jgi:putative redox protein
LRALARSGTICTELGIGQPYRDGSAGMAAAVEGSMTPIIAKYSRVSFPGGKRVDATLGDHTVHTDQSPEHGGEGAAPEPFDLFLASLATCAGAYVLGFCQARDIPTAGIWLSQESVLEHGELSGIRLQVHLPSAFPEKYVGAVRAAAASCRVKKVLADPPQITIETQREQASASWNGECKEATT